MSRPRFHLAFPVTDLAKTRAFYSDLLGCSEGRSAPRWVDFDFYGHQISAHLIEAAHDDAGANPVDGDHVPIPHFGLILPWDQFFELAERLKDYHQEFVIGPRIRFEGQPGEQATLFVRDPSGNALEFKAFRRDTQVFET